MDSAGLILYEFPCNEKIRMYLRLEHLFGQFNWFCAQNSSIAHHAALSTIFDLTDASARSDLKNELLQELDRERLALQTAKSAASGPADVDASLEALARISQEIRRTVGRSGQSIRDNEWLQLIRTRQSIAGGTCSFDMPMLHYWLSLPDDVRRAELEEWVRLMRPIEKAVGLVLDHIRSTVSECECTAENGMHQLPLGGRKCLLLQIWLPKGEALIPEVSVNKYMLWMRFSRPDEKRKLHIARERVLFKLGICG